jgi:hypothetical protein
MHRCVAKRVFFRQKIRKRWAKDNPCEITFHYLTGQAKNDQKSALFNRRLTQVSRNYGLVFPDKALG